MKHSAYFTVLSLKKEPFMECEALKEAVNSLATYDNLLSNH